MSMYYYLLIGCIAIVALLFLYFYKVQHGEYNFFNKLFKVIIEIAGVAFGVILLINKLNSKKESETDRKIAELKHKSENLGKQSNKLMKQRQKLQSKLHKIQNDIHAVDKQLHENLDNLHKTTSKIIDFKEALEYLKKEAEKNEEDNQPDDNN